MSKSMSKSKTKKKLVSQRPWQLLVVAHPDDETIFFSGLLASTSKKNWLAVCVTDGNADNQGELRKLQFKDALGKHGIKNHVFLNHRDRYESRLDTVRLIRELKTLPHSVRFENIYTHGPLGEYGHPHHQDVSYAVHSAFAGHKKLFSISQNAFPDQVFTLSKRQFDLKTEILSKTYLSETERFIFFVPATSTESFVRVTLAEVQALYRFWTENIMPGRKELIHYKWLQPYLPTVRSQLARRPF